MPSFSVTNVTPIATRLVRVPGWPSAMGVSTFPLLCKGFAASYTARMAHYEEWFKALWNACIDALDETPDLDPNDTDHPMYGVLETMHGIAEGEEEMWLHLPAENGSQPEPILNKYPDY